MGLFLTEDGHYQSWYSALLCCAFAVGRDEDPAEIERDKRMFIRIMYCRNILTSNIATTHNGVCNEQPQPLAELPATPLPQGLAAFKGDEPVFQQPRHNTRVSDRPPSIKPLDLGEDTLMNRWSLILGRPKPAVTHNSKPSISAPYGFRRLDATEAQRTSLVPLRLGPVVLRESPVPPDTHSPKDELPAKSFSHERSDSTEDLLPEDEPPRSYRTNRDTPFERCQQRSSTMWPLPPATSPVAEQPKYTFEEQRAPAPTISSRSSSSSLRRSGAGEGSAASSLSSRPSNGSLKLKRKRSVQSMRKAGAEVEDAELEREVMELNTIVEERRNDATRGNSPEHHVAAIAPSMQVRARAETLDAIGSAFSRPLTAQSNYRNPRPSVTVPERPVLRRTTSATVGTTSRVSGWLSGIFPSNQQATNEPFYKCQPPPRLLQRSHSEMSVRTSVTEMESPSLTAASSPTTKGHSRSHTGESRITPISPATTYNGYGFGDERYGKDELWPTVMTPVSQVGVAL
jgi:hypothetical protein